MKTALRAAAIVLLLAAVAPALASACPLCKEATPDAPGAASVWRGMYWSILFMVAAPFAMVGTMIVMIRRARRHGVAALRVPGSKLGKPASELET